MSKKKFELPPLSWMSRKLVLGSQMAYNPNIPHLEVASFQGPMVPTAKKMVHPATQKNPQHF